jgi:DNA-binding LacI/PurR family transcriptional regulator
VLSADIPTVLINRPSTTGRYSTVTVDFRGGAQQAVDHLVSLGHTRIGLLLRSGKEWPGQMVHAGAVEALRRHGLEPAADLEAPIGRHNAREICSHFVASGATAICTGDIPAIRCIDELAAMGLDVPADMSVVGFDDRKLVPASGRTLTTIGFDKHRMGRLAGGLLLKLTRRRSPYSWLGVAVRTQLVPGQTTAPARASLPPTR